MEAALARLESAGANGRIFSSEFKSRGGGVRFDTQGEFYTYPVFNLIHLPTSVLYVNKPSQDFDNFIALFVHEGVHQLQNTVIYTNRDEAGAYATEGYVRQELGLTGIFYEGQFFKQIYLAIEPDGHITWNLAKLCAVRKVLTTNIYTQSKWGDYGAQPVAPLMPAVLCSLCVTP